MSELSQKLKELGVRVGAADLPAPQKDERAIEAVVRGEYLSTPRGDAFVADQTFAKRYSHGANAPLASFLSARSAPLALLSEWANDPRIAQLNLDQFAFLDTETSGMAGGTGTYAFLVGAGRFLNGQFTLRQFFLRDPSEEPAMLEALMQFLAPCEALVTFNGKAFDAPLLRARYALHHIPVPFQTYAHLDLLPLARRLWRDRLPSRALKYLEEHVLNFTRASEEVPGYEIPWLYFDYLRTRDARPLNGVFYHNAMDVVAMAALLNHISAALNDPYGRIQHGLDFIALAKLFEDLQRFDEAARLFERGLESELSESDFEAAVKRLSALQKKRGNLPQALRWWRQAAQRGHLYAHIELAKYYEHQRRDISAALTWTQRAEEALARAELPAYIRSHWQAEITHRAERLRRKAGV
ncbi:MAG: metal-dependent exonucleaseMrfB [Anaerolineales bacterium]